MGDCIFGGCLISTGQLIWCFWLGWATGKVKGSSRDWNFPTTTNNNKQQTQQQQTTNNKYRKQPRQKILICHHYIANRRIPTRICKPLHDKEGLGRAGKLNKQTVLWGALVVPPGMLFAQLIIISIRHSCYYILRDIWIMVQNENRRIPSLGSSKGTVSFWGHPCW